VYPRFFATGRRWQYGLALLILTGVFIYLKKLLFQSGIFPFPLDFHLILMLFFPTVFFISISIAYRMVMDKIHFENEQLKMELKFLRSQANPHFLFNVLNNMVSMARKKSDQLETSLIKLSGLMRYMLYESGDKKVPLVKEVEYLKSYIELQKIRFSDDVPVRVYLDGVSNSHEIEPMLLIPFVENAFKHGTGLIDDPMIDISFSMDHNTMFFKVINKFDKKNKQKDYSSGIGLNNVKKRLELLYPDQHQLEISQADNMFKIHLKLTLK
jgi:two-component system, LytTR family, sensor kinase